MLPWKPEQGCSNRTEYPNGKEGQIKATVSPQRTIKWINELTK